MRWSLILEEFGPELKYIKGEKNVVANALYRLEISDNQDILNVSEIYGYDDANMLESACLIFIMILSKHRKLMLN